VSPFSAADYIQLACAGRHSVRIEVQRAGALAGHIFVCAGELWHAQDAAGEGLDALRRLLFLDQGEVSVSMLDTRLAGTRRLHGAWQAVMLDAARSHDEHVRASSMPPAPSEAQGALAAAAARPGARPRSRSGSRPALLAIAGGGAAGKVVTLPVSQAAALPSTLVSERFNALLERAVEAMLRRRLRDAYELFSEAAVLQPEDARVRANLARLGQLGFPGGSA